MTNNNCEVVKQSKVIFLAVKPHIVPTVLREVGLLVTLDKLVVSIAAGITIHDMAKVKICLH